MPTKEEALDACIEALQDAREQAATLTPRQLDGMAADEAWRTAEAQR